MKEYPFDVGKILEMIPHRYPFLLNDRITEFEKEKRAVGLKNVTVNEPWCMGHFPEIPTMPAVLILEALAQVAAVLVLSTRDDRETSLVYLAGIDKARFRRPVRPGDQLRLEREVIHLRNRACRVQGTATVEGETAAQAEFLATLVDKEGAR